MTQSIFTNSLSIGTWPLSVRPISEGSLNINTPGPYLEPEEEEIINLTPVSNPSSPVYEINPEDAAKQAQELLDKFKTNLPSNFAPPKTETDNIASGIIRLRTTDSNQNQPSYIPKVQEEIYSRSEPSYTSKSEEEKTYTYQAPSYSARNENKQESYSFIAPSYIGKDTPKDSFDEAFGFISPSYIPRGKQSQERIVSATAPSYISRNRNKKESYSSLAPSYTPKNKKSQEKTQPTQSPSYISKEYLKRASRY